MAGLSVGYEFLRQALGLQLPPPPRRAEVRAVTRVEWHGDVLAVPRHVAPGPGETYESPDACLVDHVVFALRYEGTRLDILHDALQRLSCDAMVRALDGAPTGAWTRKACYLWEEFTAQRLPVDDRPATGYVGIFGEDRYFTNPRGPTSTRWRVRFNGLGSLRYCATVERTPEIQQLLAHKVMDRLNDAMARLGNELLRRTLDWAYLSETQGSFAIEGEEPGQTKAQTFAAVLRQAHQKRPLSEDYLCELQNEVLTNPLLREYQFRDRQNWLRAGGGGSSSVTYVPPPPGLAAELMAELMAFANAALPGLDPLIAAGVTSFGFVFIHPFMDGNGRLGRLLIHHALCLAGVLDNGFVLPISVAMHRNEQEYLSALTAFSAPVRGFWSVVRVDGDQFDCQFLGSESLYRYWDATPATAFTLRMASQAVERDLLEESRFISDFDRVYRAVSSEHDLRSNDLAVLVTLALREGGLSAAKRKRYGATVQPAAMDMIEAEARRLRAEEQ